VVISCGAEVIARHPRSYEREDFVFDPLHYLAPLFEETRRNGLVASRSGPYRNVIRMCPPLCLSMSDVDEVADRFERSFQVVSSA
jgi:acetylornithine/succinyldiaminopimelate/putrescine aminotransferase